MEYRGLLGNKTNKELKKGLWKALTFLMVNSFSKLWNTGRTSHYNQKVAAKTLFLQQVMLEQIEYILELTPLNYFSSF